MGITTQCSIACHASDHDDCNHLLSKSISSLPASLPSLSSHGQPPPHCLHQCIATLRAHSSHVAALAVHGTSIYSGGSDQEIRFWPSFLLLDLSSSTPTTDDHLTSFTVAETNSPVKSLVVSGDNLFSSHQDGKICVWQIDQRERHCYKLRAVMPTSKDRFVSFLSPKNHVQVRRHKKRTWVHHVDAVSALALSHDGTLLYSVSWDRALKVWRTAAGGFRCVESLAGAHQDAINAVAVSRDGHVYTGSADARVKVWRRSEGDRHELVQTLEGHAAAVNALALGGEGEGARVLYSGACDRAVVVWEWGGDGRMAAAGALRGHRGAVLCLAAVGEVVCSGSEDRTVRVWRRGERPEKGCIYCCLAVLEGHGGPVKSLAASAVEEKNNSGSNGSSSSRSSSLESSCSSSWLVFSGGLDCDVKMWRLSVPLQSESRQGTGIRSFLVDGSSGTQFL